MSDRKAILTCLSAVALLSLGGLSVAQEAPAEGPAEFKIRSARQRLVVLPDFGAFITGTGNHSRRLNETQQAPWSIIAYERYEALKPTP